jgi:hypothetical protein
MLKTIGRRQFLVAGGGCVALPLLESALPRAARAATPADTCFLVFFAPGGRVEERWHPTGGETGFELPDGLAPLAAFRQELVIFSGLALHSANDPRNKGHSHSRGMGSLLTGSYVPFGPYETCDKDTTSGFAAGPSLDQVLAREIGTNTRFRSLELAMRWPTDTRDRGTVAPTNCINFSAPETPVPCETDPFRAYQRLFGDLAGSGSLARSSDRLRRRRSVLDAVQGEYASAASRLGALDRTKLEQHLEQIRSVEQRLGSELQYSCSPLDPGPRFDFASDEALPRAGRLMMDLMVMALECGLTRVGTIQFSDSQANNAFPWLGLHEVHHGYQHEVTGTTPEGLAAISRWYMGELAYLLGRLGEVRPDGSRLLDRSLVLYGSEISLARSHGLSNMPFLLAGKVGGLRGGRHLRYDNVAHNNLLLAIAQAFGSRLTTFGLPEYSSGPLTGLFG